MLLRLVIPFRNLGSRAATDFDEDDRLLISLYCQSHWITSIALPYALTCVLCGAIEYDFRRNVDAKTARAYIICPNVALPVIGKAQRREIPDEAEPILREFSIHVSAQPEAVTGTTLFNVFWSGLSFGVSPSGPGLISGAVEILKTFHWDLGEHFYRLQDWSLGGWRVDGFYWAAYHVTGTICNGLDQPFTLHADGGSITLIVGDFTLTPTSENGGDWTFSGFHSALLPVNGTGTFAIEGVAEGAPVIRMGGGTWTITGPPVGTVPLGYGGQHLGIIDSIALEPASDECLGE